MKLYEPEFVIALRYSRRQFLHIMGVSGAALLGAKYLSACSPHTAAAQPMNTTRNPDVEIALRAIQDDIPILGNQTTRVWRYTGEVLQGDPATLQPLPQTYLGPILHLEKGQTVRVNFTNDLPEESIIHWHGMHVPPNADGHPDLAIQPGETYRYDFTVADRAGTYWYHPHPHGRTGPQAYAGLAGLVLVHDDQERLLDLPSGDFDIPLVIQDRTFNTTSQLVYSGLGMMDQMLGFLGESILINGQPDVELKLSSTAYRLRLLNGSNSRIYKLAWEDGSPFTVIATDGGLLEKPVQRNYLTLAPAQRREIWVDLSDKPVGTRLRLVSLPADIPGGGSGFPILGITIAKEGNSNSTLSKNLSPMGRRQEADAVNRLNPRIFDLVMGRGMQWTINGRTFEMMDVARDEVVKLGDLEVWEFRNRSGGMGMSGMMNLPHPMHIHGLQFQVIERQVESALRSTWSTVADGLVDEGWQDTVLVMPGERVRVLLKFEDFSGLYLYHCHNLEHEDMGMMRNYRINA